MTLYTTLVINLLFHVSAVSFKYFIPGAIIYRKLQFNLTVIIIIKHGMLKRD